MNRTIAIHVAAQLLQYDIRALLQPSRYAASDGAFELDHHNAFRLALVASPWPHPAAMLAPFYFAHEGPKAFRSSFEAAVAEDDLAVSCKHAMVAEECLAESAGGVIAIGQVIGCMTTRNRPLWCPPSGWIDFSQINDT
jgi:hypothetical protein